MGGGGGGAGVDRNDERKTWPNALFDSRIVVAVGVDTDGDLDGSSAVARVIWCGGEVNCGGEEVDPAVLHGDLAAEHRNGNIHCKNAIFQLQAQRILVLYNTRTCPCRAMRYAAAY